MTTKTVATTLVLLLVTFPAASAQEEIETSVTWTLTTISSIEFRANITFAGAAALELRNASDADLDGTVTAAEVVEATAALAEGFNLSYDNEPGPRIDGLALDKEAPRFSLDGLEGSVAAEAPVTFRVDAVLARPDVPEAPRHTWTLDVAAERPIRTVINAPPGFAIANASAPLASDGPCRATGTFAAAALSVVLERREGACGAATTVDPTPRGATPASPPSASPTLPTTAEGGGDGERGSPGVPAVWLLAAIALVVAVVRRRARDGV